jgi:serine/threonine protein kinase
VARHVTDYQQVLQRDVQLRGPSAILCKLEDKQDISDDMDTIKRTTIPTLIGHSTKGTSWHGKETLAEESYLTPQSFLSVKLLGAGGFSTVDEVVHRATNLRISRKTLKNRDQSAFEELRKEVDVLQKLRHPHIIRFLGAYSKEDKVSILLSPVADTTLAVWLQHCHAEKPAGLDRTLFTMFGCLVSSIRYLHEQRPIIKHMDIKPQNILVKHGSHGTPHVILCDFGTSTAEVGPAGDYSKPLTRQYCAPEVVSGKTRSTAYDIWSLGCVLLETIRFFGQDDSHWLDLRREFCGRQGKYYWEDIPRLQDWLSTSLDQANSNREITVISSVKSMLQEDPAERPSAAMLTMIFPPAPCCLGWPNEEASFPEPMEELQLTEALLGDDDGDDDYPARQATIAAAKQKHARTFKLDYHIACAKAWLTECCKNHEVCHREATDAKALPTRLLDIRPGDEDTSLLRLVNGADILRSTSQVEYAAISQLWSESDATLTTKRLRNPGPVFRRDELSKLLNKAIAAADRIGIRYIWVDSLCVIQDCEEDKRSECGMMASIFRNAILTILPDQDHAAWQSISGRTHAHLNWQSQGFAWDTRAWCLQERLLCTRLLHLTGGQLYWECHSLKASETFPHGLPPLVWERVHTRSSHGRNTTPPRSTISLQSIRNSPALVITREPTKTDLHFGSEVPLPPVSAENVDVKEEAAADASVTTNPRKILKTNVEKLDASSPMGLHSRSDSASTMVEGESL